MIAWIVLSSVGWFGLFAPSNSWSQGSGGVREPVELTQTDLFSQPDWQHRPIAVDGFVLGMTREKATQCAEAHGLVLLPMGIDQIPPPRISWEVDRACCRPLEAVQAHGPHRNGHGHYVGVHVYFDRMDRVAEIGIEFSEVMDPGVQKANITRRFRGLTYRFFNDFSDGLRQKIFGSVQVKEQTIGSITHTAYDYADAGVIVRVDIDATGRNNPGEAPDDVELDFTARG